MTRRRAIAMPPLAAAGLLAAAACGGAAETQPATDPDLLLVLDGDVVVRRTDVEPLRAYLESLDPSLGRKYVLRELLDQHVLPTALARRAFPAERAAARRDAEALRSVADNSIELRRKGELAGGVEPPAPLARGDLPLAVAAWAFEPEHLGAVSPPIETSHGYWLIAPLDLEPGLTPIGDRLRAFFVVFETQSPDAHDAWLGAQRLAMRGRVEQVAPELAAALPRWLEPPARPAGAGPAK